MKFLGLALLLSTAATAQQLDPSVGKLANSTVMITNLEESGGGTGVILSSLQDKSYILTNSHVCELVVRGGKVKLTSGYSVTVRSYVRSDKSDLCMITVPRNLGANTKVSEISPVRGEKVIVSGHPNLLPQIVSYGSLSDHIQTSIITEAKECKEADFDAPETKLVCEFAGVIPVIKHYNSQVITATIAPGSSGSAVYNCNYEIVGMVFASRSRELSYGIIVPLEQVKTFLAEVRNKQVKWRVPDPTAAIPGDTLKTLDKKFTGKAARKVNNKVYYPAIYSRELDKLYERMNKSEQ